MNLLNQQIPKILPLLLLFGLVSPAVTASETALSLEAALDQLHQVSPEFRMDKEKMERAQQNLKSAKGKFLPQVELNARTTIINDPIVMDLNDIRTVMLTLHPQVPAAMIPSFEAPVQDDIFHNLSVSAQWPVFTGGKILANYRAANQQITSVELKNRIHAQEKSKELIQRYFQLQLTHEVSTLRDSLLKTVELHAENARKLAEQGMISKAELLRAQVAKSNAWTESRKAERQQELAQVALNKLLNSDTDIQPTTPLFEIKNMPELKDWTELAKSNHPAIQLIQSESKRSEQGVSATRANFMPTVVLFGNKEIYTEDLTMLQPEWAVGVALKYPLFKGGQDLQKYRQAQSTHRELGFYEQKTKRDIQLLVEKQYHALKNAMDELKWLEETRLLAEESFRSQSLAFASGLATSLDVVDAQQALFKVKVARLKALYEADMAYTGLLQSTNQIEKIKEIAEVR